MARDRFYIGPFDSSSGLDKSVKPYLIPDNAFARLNNAYIFRGRVKKRFGSRWFGDTQLQSRLRINIGTTGASPSTVSLPGTAANGFQMAAGQIFSIGDDVFTVTTTGAAQATLTTSGTITAAIDTTLATQTITFTGAPNPSTVYWYPSLPVMGLLTLETRNVNQETIIAFDQNYSYKYTAGTGWDWISAGSNTWTGSNSEFFWGANWQGTNVEDVVLFVTNNNSSDGLKYTDGTTWTAFAPQVNSGGTTIQTARLLMVFKGRLIALNTTEGGTAFPFRARYSGYGSPLATNIWRQDIAGNGNFIDASTQESIISAEFIRDRLIVFFERSTWELAYTGNQVAPFTWQKINTELGVESTRSVVPFDKIALGIGNVGIHACNGSSVERIDSKIPDEIFEIHNDNDGTERVAGVRDYRVEMVYWAYPDQADSSFPYPNKVLVYNYATGTWGINDDSITAFGFYQPTTAAAVGVTWDSTTVTWDSDETWGAGASNQAYYRFAVAGNQQGYTFIVDQNVNVNAPALQITNLSVSSNVVTVTSYNHNLRLGDFIRIQGVNNKDIGANLADLLNGYIFQVDSDPLNEATPNSFTFTFENDNNDDLSGTYTGGGYMSRVSNVDILTKQYNPYAQQGRNVSINKISFFVDKTASGETTVDYFVSSSVTPIRGSSSELGTGALETYAYSDFPYEATSARLWRPVYFDADGESIQFQIKMTPAQMTQIDEDDDGNLSGPALQDFELHAMILHADPTSNRLQ